MPKQIDTSIQYNESNIENFITAIQSKERISGLKHKFYNYPARFSPEFVREAIQTFTNIDDLIIDPFVGGGTTLTEARLLSRRSLGTDLNELAIFVTQLKTMLLKQKEADGLFRWCDNIPKYLNIRKPVSNKKSDYFLSYTQNLSTRQLWPIRKTLELAIKRTSNLSSNKTQQFARGILLKSGQWAIDGKRQYPSAEKLRYQIQEVGYEMIEGALDYTTEVKKADSLSKPMGKRRSRCIHASAENIPDFIDSVSDNPPKLIITSPPYPGVHVLYHRWQVDGGRETGAPYWITNKSDGFGASYYTFGSRQAKELESYYFNLLKVFTSLNSIVNKNTIIVQLVAFTDYSWQLTRYLETMEEAGFVECKLSEFSEYDDDRIWREVPNRKWHANAKGYTESSEEVVLFHKLK